MTDDERIAYLAGQPEAEVDPSDRAALDDLRGLLAEPAVWADPDPALEERVVAAISEAAPPNDHRAGDYRAARRRRSTLARAGGLLAAVAIVLALVLILTNARAQPVRFRAALAGTDLSPGASGEATLTKTTGGWRVNLQPPGFPGWPTGGSTRPGSKPEGCPGPHRDVQPTYEHHFVGWRPPDGVPDPYRHPAVSERQPRVFGGTGPRGPG